MAVRAGGISGGDERRVGTDGGGDGWRVGRGGDCPRTMQSWLAAPTDC